jgi:antitoxin component YwqK of YwqJK toxin-antitoxin module
MSIYRDKQGRIIVGGEGKKHYPVSKRSKDGKAIIRTIYKHGKIRIW